MVGIIAAMNEEVKVFLNELKPELVEQEPFKIYQKDKVVILICQIGLVNAATATTYFLTKYNLDFILNIGTCGAINQNLKQLDKVIVEQAFYSNADATKFGYDYGQVPRMPKCFFADQMLIEKISQVDKFKKVNIASSDVFINSLEQKENVITKIKSEISIVDMESTAIFQTAFVFQKEIVSIKIISDSIYFPNSEGQFNLVLKDCAQIISEILFKVLKQLNYI